MLVEIDLTSTSKRRIWIFAPEGEEDVRTYHVYGLRHVGRGGGGVQPRIDCCTYTPR